MKKIMLSMAVLAIVFVSCEKEDNINPSSVQLTEDSTSELPEVFKGNSMNNKLAGVGNDKCVDIDAAPNQDPCADGQGYCEEIIITPSVVMSLSSSIDNDNVANFLTPSVISTLSGGSAEIENSLTEVSDGDKKIIEIDLPKTQGSRKAFLIGDWSVTLDPNNSDVGLVYEL
ncbi:MAG: hypothetical protein ACJAV5_000018 [Vicingaceae bacterium]|jgi:hypothetical protein